MPEMCNPAFYRKLILLETAVAHTTINRTLSFLRSWGLWGWSDTKCCLLLFKLFFLKVIFWSVFIFEKKSCTLTSFPKPPQSFSKFVCSSEGTSKRKINHFSLKILHFMLFSSVSLSPPDDHNLSSQIFFYISEFVNVNRITTKKVLLTKAGDSNNNNKS